LNKLKLHYINCENDLKKFDKLQQNNKKKFIFSNLLTFWTRLAQLKNCCTERRTNYKSKHFATDHWGFHPRILK